MYKQSRASDINTTTHCLDVEKPSYWRRFEFSLVHRSEKKQELDKMDKFLKEYLKKQEKKSKRGVKSSISRKKKTFIDKSRKRLNEFLPIVVVWCLRILLGFQAYMYHSNLGLLHLAWVLLSFVITYVPLLYITIVLLLPVYLTEFVMIYSLKIPIIENTYFVE